MTIKGLNCKKFTYENDCKFLCKERCYNHKNQILNGIKVFDLCHFSSRLEACKKCSFYKKNNNETFSDNIVISDFSKGLERDTFNIIIFNENLYKEIKNLIIKRDFYGFMGFKVYFPNFIIINKELELNLISMLLDCGLIHR